MKLSNRIAGARTKQSAKRLSYRFYMVARPVAIGAAILAMSLIILGGRTHTRSNSAVRAGRAVLSDSLGIQASGRGNPWINVTDGHDLLTAYDGPSDLVSLIAHDRARPLSLASADFDEDGMPDVLAGYGTARGGIVALHRGNVDSVYPNSPAAKRRKAEGTFSDVPFLAPARLFETSVAPDFVEVGDFDADGHQDLVLASRGDNSIYFMAGDGAGQFRLPEAVVLPGRVAAMTSGDVNRADGLADLVIAVSENQASKLLVFEGSRGAVRSIPEAIDLPSEATSIEIGYLTDAPQADIAVAAGRELLIVHGRDRKLFLSEQERIGVTDPQITRRTFPSKLTSLAIGDFTGDLKLDLGVALEDGTVQVVSQMKPRGKSLQAAAPVEDWTVDTLATNSGTAGAKLFCARLSALSHETLVMEDTSNHKLQVWMDDDERRKRGDVTLKALTGEREKPVGLDVDGEPVAVLPMRLNMDGLSDLVVLRSGHSSIAVVTSVSSVVPVCNQQDCVNCGSLRDAITAANGSGGGNVITFQNGTFNQVTTITLSPQLGPLPTITKALTIDGAQAGNVSCGGQAESGPQDFGPQSLSAIQLTTTSNATNGITIQTGGCVLRDFIVNRFQNGVQVANSRGSIVEGNLIGTDPSGTQTRPNTARGVLINNAGDNTIGGTVDAATNFITGNALGVEIAGNNGTDNRVRLNFIGVTADNFAVGNGNGNGVSITNGASRNTIGGNFQGTGNNIAGNVDGLAIVSGTANIVQRNAFDLNTGNGATINSSGNTIGGTPQTDTVTNGFFRGGKNGVELNGGGATNNLIQSNLLGVNFDNSGNALDRHNALHGIALTNNASGNFIGSSTDRNLRNVIAFNLGDGVSIASGTGNQILINSISSNGGLGIDLGNDGRDINDDKDLDSGANNKQNYPVLVSAFVSGSALTPGTIESPTAMVTVQVMFNSTPNQSFDMHFYSCPNPCSTSGDQFVQCIPQFLDKITVTTDPLSGNFSGSFAFDLGAGVSSGFVNATATNNTTKDTSEFSSCVQIGACSFGVNPQSASVGASSGTGNFAVMATSGCAWTATSDAAWLTTTSTGIGNGTVNYSFAQNTTAGSRTGAIHVFNATYTVTQAGAACSFMVSPLSTSVGASSGGGSFGVTAAVGCGWTAASDADWLTTTSTGSGNGTVNYSFSQNTTAGSRIGNIHVGNAAYTVTQAGVTASPVITFACKGDGKQLIITGTSFGGDSKVFIESQGDPSGFGAEKTSVVSSTQVIALKAGKRTFSGDKIKVHTGGVDTPEFTYTRVNCSP